MEAAMVTATTFKLRRSVKTLVPKKVGPCEALIPRWFYNSQTGQCEQFNWGGCDPNDNNFATLKECRKTCGRKNKN
ncbi:PREDICTED: PI-actitoxin-Axm2a-like isoform X2 [Branchiostoma belcheri]|uniref:PI-actitoxin-Axm2a-like isoform X2 n=1 Tax=Branchiostoma belcheri TaxID=7741 RepID=A0A6P5ANB8_BRABE|nr:PREDICTED: PI-actitoxin-Axm2a-like isoform X2 [Branchiostoma belcheri]